MVAERSSLQTLLLDDDIFARSSQGALELFDECEKRRRLAESGLSRMLTHSEHLTALREAGLRV